MKNLKKLIVFLCFAFILVMILSSCDDKRKPKDYYLDKDGNLIVKYDDNTTNNLGDFDESIIKSIDKVSISDDGYYIIGGVKTTIKVDYSKVEISDDGFYIINKVKTTIKVDFSKVDISKDGYYVINKVKTTIKVDYSKVEISKDGYYVINDIKTTIKVDYSKVEISDDGYYVIDGIKTDVVATNIYTVDFTNGGNIKSQKIREAYKVERPDDPQKEGYSFGGWYCNNEEWRFNSDVVMNDMTLTAKWTANKYTISFDDELYTSGDIEVTYDSEYTLPELSKNGYTFNGWMYENKLVDSKTWNIASNVTLTASWTANEYTVTLDPNGGSVSSSSVKVTYNENYTLPVPTNNVGIFRGWYIGDTKMTDENGNSLNKWTFTADKTFTTTWIQDVSTYNDLQKIAFAPGGHYKLINDIDLKDLPWTPVELTGVFDGNNHSISNLTITSNNMFNGLFSIVGGTVKNLNLVDVNINVPGGYTAAVAGGSDNAIFENITISGTINNSGSGYNSDAAGVVSYSTNTAYNNIVNNATVTSKNLASGIVSSSPSLGFNAFTSCINNGTINGSEASGIASYGVFEKCKNTGNITGIDLAAGISTSMLMAQFCVNTGNVTANTTVGYAAGIGAFENSNFQKLAQSNDGMAEALITNSGFGAEYSYNTGNITGKRAGGILSGDLVMYLGAKCCYNTGTISGNDYAGGIAPTSCNVTNCVNFGTISSGTIKTSICAEIMSTYKMKNCYYYGSAYDTTYCIATETTERYSSDLYVTLLTWSIKTPTKTGYWILYANDYPKLYWEE